VAQYQLATTVVELYEQLQLGSVTGTMTDVRIAPELAGQMCSIMQWYSIQGLKVQKDLAQVKR
jgi:hypothetical protein